MYIFHSFRVTDQSKWNCLNLIDQIESYHLDTDRSLIKFQPVNESMGSRLVEQIISDWIVQFDISQHDWMCLGR